jgi:hypothetical protein
VHGDSSVEDNLPQVRKLYLAERGKDVLLRAHADSEATHKRNEMWGCMEDGDKSATRSALILSSPAGSMARIKDDILE